MEISTRKVKRLMGENLFTQAALAQAANVSRATINTTLGRGSCSTLTAGKIAAALGVKVSEILEEA